MRVEYNGRFYAKVGRRYLETDIDTEYIEKLQEQNKESEILIGRQQKQILCLEDRITEMKCGGNCKHLYHVNTGGCYDAKCDLTYCDCINCKDNWELRR